MIDQVTRLGTMIKDEIGKLAIGYGLNSNDVGYSVTQAMVPRPGPDGNQGMFMDWVVTLSLRVPILGTDKPTLMFPVVVPSPVLGFMPPDQAFRESVKMALEKLNEMCQEFMSQFSNPNGLNLQQAGPTMQVKR